MPFSLDRSHPWEKITKKWVIDLLGSLVRAADDEDNLDDWIEKKFDRDETDRSYIIGQFQNDLSIFRTSVLEFVKHPNAIFMQFRGEAFDEIDMWRWESAPLAPHSSPKEKYIAFKNGHLVALDEDNKEDTLNNIKSNVTLIAVAHGEAYPRTNADTGQPEEAAAGLSGAGFAEAIKQVLQRIAANGAKDFYTRFIICNVVMPQERAADINSFSGNYVREVNRAHPQFERVETSGTPFLMVVGSDFTQVRRKLRVQPEPPATADTLITLGWGHKFRVLMEQRPGAAAALSDSGYEVELTAFERNVFGLCRKSNYPLFKLLDEVQLLLAEPATSTLNERLADRVRWRLLALVLLSIPVTIPSRTNLWQEARLIEIGGGSEDVVTITRADGSMVQIENLRRDLLFFKEKMAHFTPVVDPTVPESYRLALKSFIQGQLRFLNAVGTEYSSLESQQPNGPAFSCLAQLGDYRNDEMKVTLSLLRNDSAFNTIAAHEIYAQTGASAPTAISWQSVRVKGHPPGAVPNRALARRLVTMSDDEVANALLFDVTLWPRGSGSLSKTASFTAPTTRHLLSCIDDCIKAKNADFAHKIGTINKWHERALLDACKNQQIPLPGDRDNVQLLRAATSTELAL